MLVSVKIRHPFAMVAEPDGLEIVKIRRCVNHTPDNGPVDLVQAVVPCFFFDNLKTQLFDFLWLHLFSGPL
jgi:hypothetical protein